jgi:hypothetical protein
MQDASNPGEFVTGALVSLFRRRNFQKGAYFTEQTEKEKH